MLWSLIKILLFVALSTAAAMGAIYLMESDGGVQITVAGTEYTMEPLETVMAMLVLLVVLWLILKLFSLLIAVLKFISGDETAISRYFARDRERRGYRALADGMMALASGEARLAMSKAAKAEKFLNKPELTNLLTAQAAEMAGDRDKATETYKKLISDDSTRFVGVRGILRQKLEDGEMDTARKLAEKALQLKPKHAETQDVLLKLQTQAQDWAGAQATLSTKLKSGTLPRDVYTRRQAVLALSEAKEILDENAPIEAQEHAIKANRMSPDLVPAAAMAARSYIEKDKSRNATRILKKAWEAQPHPELAAAFAEIKPDEIPQERIKRFAVLTKIHPEHTENRLVRAELHIVAGEYEEARSALGDLASTDADARALTLMAAIEKGQGASDAVVQGWLTRALNAPRGPQWVCENCHHIHGDWAPVCPNCGGFDTLSWTTPQVPEIASATGAHLLPILTEPAAEPDPEIKAESDPGPVLEEEDFVAEEAEPVEDAVILPPDEGGLHEEKR